MGKDPACTSYSLFPIIHAAGHRLQQGGGAPTSDPRVRRHAKRKMIFPAVSRPLTAAFFSRARHCIWMPAAAKPCSPISSHVRRWSVQKRFITTSPTMLALTAPATKVRMRITTAYSVDFFPKGRKSRITPWNTFPEWSAGPTPCQEKYSDIRHPRSALGKKCL